MQPTNLETHPTKCRITSKSSGIMTPLWKDYEFSKLTPRFVYHTTCNPGTTKGPFIHTKRSSLLSVIHGHIVLIYKETPSSKDYKEIEIDANKQPQSIYIPKNTPNCIVNIGSGTAVFVSVNDHAWRPDDNETVIADFSDYDFSKWLNKSK